MAKRIVIHAGFFKTGTTALQSSLAANRKKLLENGVLYPALSSADSSRSTGQHRAAWALKGRHWGWEDGGGSVTPIEVWDKLAGKLNDFEGTSLFSSEFLAELTRDDVERMSKDLKADKIEVVFTLRPLVKMLPSQYIQSLKYGMRLNYEGWLQRIFNGGEDKVQWRTFWTRHDHPDVVKRWVDVFGAENVTLLVVDETQPNLIYETFSELLSLPNDLLKPVEEKGLNRSLTWEEICLLLEMNKKFDRTLAWGEYATMIRNGIFRNLTDVPARDGQHKLLTPQWAVDRAKELTVSNIQRLHSMGITIIGDIDGTANADVPTGVNEPISSLPLDFAAELLLLHKQESILLDASGKQIRAEFFRRLNSKDPSFLKSLVTKILKKLAK
jgi:hypothetical protein